MDILVYAGLSVLLIFILQAMVDADWMVGSLIVFALLGYTSTKFFILIIMHIGSFK